VRGVDVGGGPLATPEIAKHRLADPVTRLDVAPLGTGLTGVATGSDHSSKW